MPDSGILDTSVLIDLLRLDEQALPTRSAITAVTLAELAAGPLAVADPVERSIRQERLQWAESTFNALPFDVAAAHSYARIYALARAAGRQHRGRFADLMIASIAASNQLPLYTRNSAGFTGLESAVTIVAV